MNAKRRWYLLPLIVALAVMALVSVPVALSWRYKVIRRRFRRRWKNDAVERIARLSEDASWIQGQIRDAEDQKAGLFGDPDLPWLREDIIVMVDGDWIVYRAVARKSDKRIDDIFIGRTSNGKWYYSTYHFCSAMYNLMTEGQPPHLAGFVRAFSLVEFDGKSDKALEETWDRTTPGYSPDA